MLLVSYIQQYFNTSITVLTNHFWKLLIALFKVPNTGAFTYVLHCYHALDGLGKYSPNICSVVKIYPSLLSFFSLTSSSNHALELKYFLHSHRTIGAHVGMLYVIKWIQEWGHIERHTIKSFNIFPPSPHARALVTCTWGTHITSAECCRVLIVKNIGTPRSLF